MQEELGDLLAPRPSWFASCASVQQRIYCPRRPYALTNMGLEIMTVPYEVTNRGVGMIPVPFPHPQSVGERYLILLNCTKDGKGPIAMTLARPIRPWMRCEYEEMIGTPESLFDAMRNAEKARQIYISAQLRGRLNKHCSLPFKTFRSHR
jgi:hypothetical protein